MSKETRLLFCTTGVILRRLQEAACTACTRHVHRMCTACALHVHGMCTARAPLMYCACAAGGLQHLHCTLSRPYHLTIVLHRMCFARHCTCTACAPHMSRMCTIGPCSPSLLSPYCSYVITAGALLTRHLLLAYLLMQEGGSAMSNISHVIVDEAHERSEVSKHESKKV